MAHVIELMMAAYDLTGNAAYLHRADHFGRLAVDLFLDEASPLPKITVTATLHDSWDDRETVDCRATLKPGARTLVAYDSSEKQFIRGLMSARPV
jgi:hypothetical protein